LLLEAEGRVSSLKTTKSRVYFPKKGLVPGDADSKRGISLSSSILKASDLRVSTSSSHHTFTNSLVFKKPKLPTV
jgi:hypothetical protein